MRDEPETALRFQCGVSLKRCCCATSPFVDLVCGTSAPAGREHSGAGSLDLTLVSERQAPSPARAKPAGGFCVFSWERGIGAVGKWKTCFWFSTFPSALVAGAVEMWESRLPLARFPRGSWKEGEACFWLSTLSTAPAFPQRFGLIVFSGSAPTSSTSLAAFVVPPRCRSRLRPAVPASPR